MHRGDLSTTQWARLHAVLPPQKPHIGRPAHDHRTIINGILWIVRTGAPWRDLPERYGPWPTVASRFYRWQRAGIWQQVFDTLKQQADAGGRLNWLLQFVDSTIIRAHQHAAGGNKGGPDAEALGRSQGGFSTTIHLRAEGHGQPCTWLLTPGQRPEAPLLVPLLEQGAVKRPGGGRPKRRPGRLVGDSALLAEAWHPSDDSAQTGRAPYGAR